MCGICGHLILGEQRPDPILTTILQDVQAWTSVRGLDTFGYVTSNGHEIRMNKPSRLPLSRLADGSGPATLPYAYNYDMEPAQVSLIGFRGIPTNESDGYAAHATQPYKKDGTLLTHNGQIANDSDLYAKHKWPTCMPDTQDIDSFAILNLYNSNVNVFADALKELEGSWAFALYDKEFHKLILSRTFRGLYLAKHINPKGVTALIWASERKALENHNLQIIEFPTHSYLELDVQTCSHTGMDIELEWLTFRRMRTRSEHNENSCAVVISGGLDSTTVATWAARKFKEVHLLHFLYGARAETPEANAVRRIADWLTRNYPKCKITLSYVDCSFLKKLGGSTLTEHDKEIAQGDAGIETVHEWVPARNTIFISQAAGYCDRHDIGNIALGLNMQESSVYSDNSQEFFDHMEAALDIGTLSRPRMRMPVANFMKSHITRYAHEIGAPLHLAWSCYEGGQEHCGTCGPCLMRLKSHKMEHIQETVSYLKYPNWFPSELRK